MREPYMEELSHTLRLEEEDKRHIKPVCIICEQPIGEYRCYCFDRIHDPMQACCHKSCFKNQMQKAVKAGLNQWLIEEVITDDVNAKYLGETPIEEREEF